MISARVLSDLVDALVLASFCTFRAEERKGFMKKTTLLRIEMGCERGLIKGPSDLVLCGP